VDSYCLAGKQPRYQQKFQELVDSTGAEQLPDPVNYLGQKL